MFLPDDCFLLIKLDLDRISLLKLEVDIDSIRAAIISDRALHVKAKDCSVITSDMITVNPGVTGRTTLYYQLQFLKEKITSVVVKGLPSVNRAVIHMDEKEANRPVYSLFVEGDNLLEVLATPGVDGRRTTSNNTLEVRK